MEKGQATSVDTLTQVTVLAESYGATPIVAASADRFTNDGKTSFPGIQGPSLFYISEPSSRRRRDGVDVKNSLHRCKHLLGRVSFQLPDSRKETSGFTIPNLMQSNYTKYTKEI